jgi:predicted metalloprotease
VGSFNDAQKTWTALLARTPRKYRNAKLVLFWDETRSACGAAGSSMGPFYCSSDERAYIDLGFYRELAQRYGAPGEFAQAYVIAHEIGHHVQNVLGTSAKVRADQARKPSQKNALSVKMELQADCYAGVWGYAAAKRGVINSSEVEEGLRAAAALGDDKLRKQAGRAIAPETFTHGASADRERWFRRGLERGTIAACDTFASR